MRRSMSRGANTILMLLAFAIGGCGDDNVADCERGLPQVPCTESSKDAQVSRAMKEGDYDTAIILLNELIVAEPEVYTRYSLLGAAYAARAGFDLLNVAKASFSGGGSLVEQMTAFLPDPTTLGVAAYELSLTDMGASVNILEAIPLARRSDPVETYARSATFQLSLYRSAYSVMYLNKFAVSTTTGSFDPAQLETMTEEDALIVIENLAAAGAVQSDNPELQSKINEVLDEINGQDGASTKEKLTEYLKQRQGSEGA